jgi:phytoene dehydrogenase-like protein
MNATPTADMYDAIVIGAGHNGLTCAAYLARAGKRVLVLERRNSVGGIAATEEIMPDYRSSACAHWISGFDGRIVRDLRLKRHGLAVDEETLETIALSDDGRHITFTDDIRETADSIEQVSPVDAAAYEGFLKRLDQYTTALAELLKAPPAHILNAGANDEKTWTRFDRSLSKAGDFAYAEFGRMASQSLADFLDDAFESELVKGALAFDGVVGHSLGPRSPGSLFAYLRRHAIQIEQKDMLRGHIRGGAGALCDALAIVAVEKGADVRLDTTAIRIVVDGDKAIAVELADGSIVSSEIVVSSLDPKTTFLRLLDRGALDVGFTRRIRGLQTRGSVAKVNLALDGLPAFKGIDPEKLGRRLIIAPNIDFLENAFNATKYGEMSEHLAIELLMPSVHDPSLTAPGQHVLSAIVQYAPFELNEGWSNRRDRFVDEIVSAISAFSPDLSSRIVGGQVLTPEDIERDYGIVGGHWHHCETSVDQSFMLRPAFDAAKYDTPIGGLYICGAGAHPGGGVTGLPGYHAAQRILRGAD